MMMLPADCTSTMSSFSNRKKIYMQRKLEMMMMFRDSLERRVAAVNATITKLTEQIDKLSLDNNSSEN